MMNVTRKVEGESFEFHAETNMAKPQSKQSWNDTGIEPVDYCCVVRLDPAEEKTIGGIIIPDDRKDRSQMAATRATLLACGGNAFWDWKGRIPAPGDRVEVSKYAGVTREADPTDLVRIIKDKEILGVLT